MVAAVLAALCLSSTLLLSSPVSAQATPPAGKPSAESARSPGTEIHFPEKLGPARIEMGAGYLDLTLALQLLATVLSAATGVDRHTSFDVGPRRMRFYPRGSFLNRRLQFGVQLNATPGSLEILDWWIGVRLLEQLQVRSGQFKIPFTRYRYQSFSRCLLVDWGNLTRTFGAERQIGIMLHNSGSGPRWDYSLGLFNGQNSRRSHGLGPADVYAVPIANPSDLRNPGLLEDRWHPELVGRLMYNSGDLEVFVPSDRQRGEFRYLLALSASWDNLADDQDLMTRNDVLRLAPEVMLKAYGASLLAITYLGVEKTAMDEKSTLAMVGWLGELAYRFDRTWELAARFSRVDYLKDLREDAGEYAAAQIAAASGTEAEQALSAQLAQAGAIKADQEIAVGLNVYLVESELKLQTEVALLSAYLEGARTRNDYRWRTQLQLAF